MHQSPGTKPATPADFHRLADLAQERGLRVFDAGDGRWFCTSASDPFALHVVTGFSCDCRGFLAHQRCSHHAALLAHLGWLPELEEETPADCADCCGCGVNDYGRYALPCETCKGSGVKPDHRLAGRPSIQPVATAAA